MAKHLRTYALFFQSLFVLPMAYGEVEQWDWVPRASLTAQQQADLNRYCQGSYVNRWQATNVTGTQLTADLIFRDAQGVTHLKGDANILQPESALSANSIEGVPEEYYFANQNVALRTNDQLIRSSSGYISSNSSTTEFKDAAFLSHSSGARGEAQLLSSNQEGVIFIEDGFFTTCEPNEESWKLYGSSIKLDTVSGFGTAKHIQIYIANVPVFYFPWLRFPIDDRRQSGFLFPSFGFSSKDGVSVSAPVYWNIAENYDATITPHFIQEKGEGIDLEFRHLSPFGQTLYEQSTFSDNLEGEQTLLKLTTEQRFNKHFNAGFLLEDNPTDDKYPEANSTSIGEKDHYQRSLYVGFNNGNFLNTVTYLTYQTPDKTINQPFEWRPRVASSYRLTSNYFDYDINAQYTDFYDPAEDNFDGQRRVLNQDAKLTLSNAWGRVDAGILAQYRGYDLYNYKTAAEETTSVGHLTHYLDTSIAFELRIGQRNQPWRQTLEPRISYLNAPYEDQDEIPNFDASEPTLTYSQAFNHIRFNGNDRIGDTEQVTLGVESRLYDENNNERWAFKAGQIFYLEDRYVGITGNTNQNVAIDDAKRSDLLTSASYNSRRYSLTGNVNYDPNNNEINVAQVIASLSPKDDIKINLSYLYSINNTQSDDDAKQASIGSIFPLNQNWSMYTQYTYDFLREDATKEVVGFGYENCCLKVSLSYQDWLNDSNEYDRGIFLQFILRSLSSAGRGNSEANIANTYWNQGNVGY